MEIAFEIVRDIMAMVGVVVTVLMLSAALGWLPDVDLGELPGDDDAATD